MAIKLQKYQKQVGPSAQGVNVRGDVGSAGAEWGAVSRFAETAGNIVGKFGGDYLEKKRVAKFAADKADYMKNVMELDSEIEEATNAFLSNPDNKFEDIHDKVVVPKLDQFSSLIANRGYGDDGMAFAENNWTVDGEKFLTKSIGDREKRELSNMTAKITDGYYIASNTGNKADMELYESQLRNIAGDKEADRVVALGVYNKNVNSLYSMTDPKDIQEFADSNEVKRMQPQQYQQFRTLASNHTKQLTANKYAPAKKEAMSMHKKGQLTEGYIRGLQLPKNEENLLIKMLSDDISESYTKNPVIVDDLVAEVDDFLDGNYDGFSENEYSNLLAKIDEAELPASVKFDIMLPIIEGQDDPSVNAPFFTKQKNAKVYDENLSVILKQYRESFNSANSGMSADVKMHGFGNGYKMVREWASKNKKAIKEGTADPTDIIRRAVQPAVSNRIKIEATKSAQRILHGGDVAPTDMDKLNAIWGE